MTGVWTVARFGSPRNRYAVGRFVSPRNGCAVARFESLQHEHFGRCHDQ